MRTVVVGFIAGALGVLIFHQLGFYVATELGLSRARIYNLQPVPPLGVPAIVSSAFWGGLWGIAAAFVVPKLPGVLKGALGWILFAAILVAVVNWFVVLPMKGLPVGGGFGMPAVIVVPVVYGFWGLGMWLISALVRRSMGWNA